MTENPFGELEERAAKSFLKSLPEAYPVSQRLLCEGVDLAADTIHFGIVEMATICNEIATAYNPIKSITLPQRVRLLQAAWSIIDNVHTINLIYKSHKFEANIYDASYFSVFGEMSRRLRNKMDHIVGNIENISNAKSLPSARGVVGFGWIEDHQIVDGKLSEYYGYLISATAFHNPNVKINLRHLSPKYNTRPEPIVLYAFDEVLNLGEAANAAVRLRDEISHFLSGATGAISERMPEFTTRHPAPPMGLQLKASYAPEVRQAIGSVHRRVPVVRAATSQLTKFEVTAVRKVARTDASTRPRKPRN